MRTTVSTKGQIILPAEIRREDNIKAGQEFQIDATALEHNLTIATRNTRDFKKTGVKTVNPFE